MADSYARCSISLCRHDLKQWDVSLLNRHATPSTPTAGSATAEWDLGVVVSFGYFLTPNVLACLRSGAINLHPSLLPKYRGAAPVPHALLNGDTDTGVSIINIDPRTFDSGSILTQEVHPIQPDDTCTSLLPRLASAGADCVAKVLHDLEGHRRNAVMQDPQLATRAPKLRPEMGCVIFKHNAQLESAVSTSESSASAARPSASTPAASPALPAHMSKPWTADYAMNAYRAFDGSIGTYVWTLAGTNACVRTRIVQLARFDVKCSKKMEADAAAASAAVGSLYFDTYSKKLLLRLCDGNWIELVRVLPAHKKEMRGLDFANGFQMKGLASNVRCVDAWEAVQPEAG